MRTRTESHMAMFCWINGCLFTGGVSLSQDIRHTDSSLHSPGSGSESESDGGQWPGLSPWHSTPPPHLLSHHNLILTSSYNWPIAGLEAGPQQPIRAEGTRSQRTATLNITHQWRTRAGWRQDSEPIRRQYQGLPTNERPQSRHVDRHMVTNQSTVLRSRDWPQPIRGPCSELGLASRQIICS